MKVEMGFWPTVAASVIAGGVLIWMQNKNAFNPVSEDNLANQAFESTYTAVTGSEESPGADFYDATHDEDGNVKWWAAPLWFLDAAAGIDNGVSF